MSTAKWGTVTQFKSKKSISEGQVRDAAALLQALEPFFRLRGTMPLQYVKSFLLAAIHEGESVTELAKHSGVSQSVMSRHLLDIGDRNRHMEKGFGLVTYKLHPTELRKHSVELTPQGQKLMHDISLALSHVKK